MKTFKKAILLVACAALLVGVSVMGTLAYLQAETDPITNTMTVGKVVITLNEALVNIQGEKLNKDGAVAQDGDQLADRITSGNSYKLVPGQTYTKDPIVHVDAASENCYLFVKVVNGIAAIEKDGDTMIAKQMEAKGWSWIGATDVYYHSDVAKAGDDVAVFDSFTIADNKDLSAMEGKTITITAYAVQADGFSDAQSAWDATFGAANS